MKYKLIMWDWNGTVVDDVKIALDAVNLMLDRERLPHINLSQYYSYVDTPISKFYEHILDLNKISFEKIGAEFNADYASLSADRLRLNDGFSELWEFFEKSACKQVIISSSKLDNILRDARLLGVCDKFSAILGADNIRAESKIERARAFFHSSGYNSDECLFIGDTLHDFETACDLGIDCVLTCQGHQSPAQFCKMPVKYYDKLSSIIADLSA